MASSPVDLEAIVIDWAKKMFDVTKSKEQGKINRDALQYTVNWKFTRTHHSEPEYSDVTKPADPKSQVRHKRQDRINVCASSYRKLEFRILFNITLKIDNYT